MKKRHVTIALVLAVVAAGILASFGFTASNTVPNETLGQGANTISGYTVSSVVYNLDATTPSNIDSVTFTLNTAATNVDIQLVSGGAWYSCTAANPPTDTNFSCTTTGATASAANSLDVVSAQ